LNPVAAGVKGETGEDKNRKSLREKGEGAFLNAEEL